MTVSCVLLVPGGYAKLITSSPGEMAGEACAGGEHANEHADSEEKYFTRLWWRISDRESQHIYTLAYSIRLNGDEWTVWIQMTEHDGQYHRLQNQNQKYLNSHRTVAAAGEPDRTGPDRHRTVTVLMFVLKSLCFFCHFPHRRTDVTVVTCVMFVMFFISLVHLKKTFKK